MGYVKLYVLLVLFPQGLWLFLSSYQGISVLCDSCTFLPPSALREKTRECSDHHDNLTRRLCTCSVSAGTSFDAEDAHLMELMRTDPLGGWGMSHCLPDLSGPCSIKRRNASLTATQFLDEFAYNEPVILTGMSSQERFRSHSTKYQLLKDYGHEVITVATANTHSYRKVQMTLCDYVEQVMRPQSYQGLGNETLYHFGDNDRERWDPLFSLYQLPPLTLPNKDPVLSFGLAGPGTGVPFHVHGATYAETVYGRKRWFLYSPSSSPVFHPDETTLRWLAHTYPHLHEKPLECTLNPGEILYLPDRWWHSTINVDSVVFVSVFYS